MIENEKPTSILTTSLKSDIYYSKWDEIGKHIRAALFPKNEPQGELSNDPPKTDQQVLMQKI